MSAFRPDLLRIKMKMLAVLFAILALEGVSGTPTWTDLKLSVDLVTASENELSFLRAVENKRVLYDEEFVLNAIRRYERCWLPLQAHQNDTNIVPPIDVHWVWHTHMLAPHYYRKDCMALVGRVIDHKSWTPAEIQQRLEASKQAWESQCQSEPYDFLEAKQKNGTKKLPFKSTYDIAVAVQRQRDFNRKILALTRGESRDYLKNALDRYKKFLFLLQTNPGSELSPSLDMDLIWHTHQTHPLIYAKDCKQIFNFLLNHDDAVDKSGLENSVKLSDTLWSQNFPDETFIKLSKPSAEVNGGNEAGCSGGCGGSCKGKASAGAGSCSGSCSAGSCKGTASAGAGSCSGSCSAGSCKGKASAGTGSCTGSCSPGKCKAGSCKGYTGPTTTAGSCSAGKCKAGSCKGGKSTAVGIRPSLTAIMVVLLAFMQANCRF